MLRLIVTLIWPFCLQNGLNCRSGWPWKWHFNDALVLVNVAWGEPGIAYKVKQAGGVWNKSKQAWELRYDKVVALQLEDRLVKEWESAGGI